MKIGGTRRGGLSCYSGTQRVTQGSRGCGCGEVDGSFKNKFHVRSCVSACGGRPEKHGLGRDASCTLTGFFTIQDVQEDRCYLNRASDYVQVLIKLVNNRIHRPDMKSSSV